MAEQGILDEIRTRLTDIFLRDETEFEEPFREIIDRFSESLCNWISINERAKSEDRTELWRRAEFLRKTDVFRECSFYDLLNFSMIMEECEVAAGAVLIVQASPVREVIFIMEGEVDILVNEEHVARRGKGTTVGEMSCLRDEPFANATVQAVTACRILKISRTDFTRKLKMIPSVLDAFFKNTILRIDELGYRFSEVLRHTPQGVMKVDRQGNLTAEISVTGSDYLSKRDLAGQSFPEVLFSNDPESRDKWESVFPRILETPSEFEILREHLPKETVFNHPETGKRNYYLHYYDCRDTKDQLTGIDVCIDDRTELIRAAEELREAKETAETANRLKSEFLAKMSHDMRTPLQGIISFSEITMEDPTNRESKAHLEIIRRESKILLDLINTLLDQSKITAGKLELEAIPFDFGQLMEEVNESLGGRAKMKGLEYEFHMGPEIPLALIGDPMRLRQILTNLAGNALKFTEEGRISVTVTQKRSTETHLLAYFEVEDTGIGIPKERQAGIFNPYQQASPSTSRGFGGSGLGTSISRELARMMNGEIGLESEPGKGSRFWFTVELQKDLSRISPEIATTAEREIDGGEKGDEETKQKEISKKEAQVLLVEDYRVNQMVVCKYLEKAGCRVNVVDNGEKAVVSSQKQVFDLIFMDISMPVMDGLTASRIIRADPLSLNRETPIIALTASNFKEDREACIENKMDDLIGKPFTRNQFLTSLHRWLGCRSLGRQTSDSDI